MLAKSSLFIAAPSLTIQKSIGSFKKNRTKLWKNRSWSEKKSPFSFSGVTKDQGFLDFFFALYFTEAVPSHEEEGGGSMRDDVRLRNGSCVGAVTAANVYLGKRRSDLSLR